MLKPTKKFITACEVARWIPDRLPIDQFGRYLEHLLSTNEHCNLTAIRDPSEAWMRHVYDSLHSCLTSPTQEAFGSTWEPVVEFLE